MKQLLISFLSLVIVLTAPTFGQVDSVTDQYMGNGNLLVNPGLESGLKSWTNVAGVLSVESSVVIKGKRAGKVVLSSQALNLYQDVTSYQAQLADGVQGLASVRVKTSVSGIKVCSRQAGVTVSTSNCVDVQANNKWGLYKVPFILGATSNGISVESVGNVTGTIYIDDAFVGPVDLKVDNSATGPWIDYGAISIGATTTAPTKGTTTLDKVRCRTSGQDYECEYRLEMTTAGTAGSGDYLLALPSEIRIDPSAHTFYTGAIGLSTAANELGSMIGEGYGAHIGAAQGDIQAIAYDGTRFRLFRKNFYSNSGVFGSAFFQLSTASHFFVKVKFRGLNLSSNTSIYSSTNADTDWASCTPSSSQGFGTPTFAVQCKRHGGDLLMKGRFTPSATTAVEARLGLPLWNGTQLVSAGSSIISALEIANGFYLRGATVTAHGGGVLIEPSVSYVTFSEANTFTGVSLNSLSKANANAILSGGEILSFNARIPIEGWQQSNIIIGQFNGLESCTSTLDCTDTFSAKVSAANVVSDENVDFINGFCTLTSTSNYSCPFKPGIFSATPNCVVNYSGAGATAGARSASIRTITPSLVDYVTEGSGVLAPAAVNIICQKQGVDYVGKTAKAVASDQSVRSIGSTNVDIQSVYFGSGANCATACTAGTCAICSQIGSKITSVTFSSTGIYLLNGIDGLKYNCNGTGAGASYTTMTHRKDASTTSYAAIYAGSGGGVLNSAHNSVNCIGIP